MCFVTEVYTISDLDNVLLDIRNKELSIKVNDNDKSEEVACTDTLSSLCFGRSKLIESTKIIDISQFDCDMAIEFIDVTLPHDYIVTKFDHKNRKFKTGLEIKDGTQNEEYIKIQNKNISMKRRENTVNQHAFYINDVIVGGLDDSRIRNKIIKSPIFLEYVCIKYFSGLTSLLKDHTVINISDILDNSKHDYFKIYCTVHTKYDLIKNNNIGQLSVNFRLPDFMLTTKGGSKSNTVVKTAYTPYIPDSTVVKMLHKTLDNDFTIRFYDSLSDINITTFNEMTLNSYVDKEKLKWISDKIDQIHFDDGSITFFDYTAEDSSLVFKRVESNESTAMMFKQVIDKFNNNERNYSTLAAIIKVSQAFTSILRNIKFINVFNTMMYVKRFINAVLISDCVVKTMMDLNKSDVLKYINILLLKRQSNKKYSASLVVDEMTLINPLQFIRISNIIYDSDLNVKSYKSYEIAKMLYLFKNKSSFYDNIFLYSVRMNKLFYFPEKATSYKYMYIELLFDEIKKELEVLLDSDNLYVSNTDIQKSKMRSVNIKTILKSPKMQVLSKVVQEQSSQRETVGRNKIDNIVCVYTVPEKVNLVSQVEIVKEVDYNDYI